MTNSAKVTSLGCTTGRLILVPPHGSQKGNIVTEGPNVPPGGQPPPPSGAQPPPPGGFQPPPPSGGQPPPPYAQQVPTAQTGIGQPADLLTRFLAKLIDSILLALVSFVVVTTLIVSFIFSGAASGFGGFGTGFSGVGIFSSLLTAALYIGYFAFLESSRGQTVGKMLMKIEVRGPDGQRPTMEQAIKRNAYFALAIIPVIGGLAQFGVMIYIAVTINSNVATRQGWHDQFADGTSVIKIG